MSDSLASQCLRQLANLLRSWMWEKRNFYHFCPYRLSYNSLSCQLPCPEMDNLIDMEIESGKCLIIIASTNSILLTIPQNLFPQREIVNICNKKKESYGLVTLVVGWYKLVKFIATSFSEILKAHNKKRKNEIYTLDLKNCTNFEINLNGYNANVSARKFYNLQTYLGEFSFSSVLFWLAFSFQTDKRLQIFRWTLAL